MIATENLNGVSGVYCAIHRENLSCYVGSSADIERRRKSHVWSASGGKSQNAFHRALRQCGKDAFDFEVLERCDRDKLRDRESFWIKFLGSSNGNGLNTCPSSAWKGLADATRARISKSLIGKPKSETHRRNSGLGIKAVWASRPFPKMSEEQRAGISERNRARKGKFSAETLEKMRLVSSGRKHTEAAKRKISESSKGRKLSQETRNNMSKAFKGRVNSPEARAKHSRLMTGKKHTVEHNLKIGLASRLMWARKRAEKNNFQPLETISGEKMQLATAAA